MITDPTKRFTDRVANYAKYRPTYPDEVIQFLKKAGKLSDDAAIADIGAGTGIFSNLLLNHGYTVFAVEPNQAMQQEAKQWLGANKKYTAIDAIAEATTLPTKSIDLVTCAQAFHWFNADRARFEFKRILHDDGHVALIWNNRSTTADAFSMAYEKLLKHDMVDYDKVNHRNITEINFKAFFKNGEYQIAKYPNSQVFDEDGLMGRAFSSSYVPAQNSESGKNFRTLLKAIFDKYNTDGKVSFHYETEIYFGKV
ncbi:class I SAM-dependent methyltransferase [Mucilaginibacter sp.]|uniref:class I SAM-dependent methyltransferase n=1 Tax=Mucilaginibacter sp. TaxID=1882438 RepID=UPI003D0CA08E